MAVNKIVFRFKVHDLEAEIFYVKIIFSMEVDANESIAEAVMAGYHVNV